MEEIEEIKHKRSYVAELEDLSEKISNLYKYKDVNCIHTLYDPYEFIESLDKFSTVLNNEISFQERKLNDSEVKIYNMIKSSNN